MNTTKTRNKHYKKISIKRYIRIILRRVFLALFLILALIITTLIIYDKELVTNKFYSYVNVLSQKLNLSLNKIEVQESIKYCTTIKPFLSHIEPNTSIFLVSITDIKNQLEQLDCIDNLTIKRQYPDTIKIIVKEKQPIAIWQNEQKFLYITEDGSTMTIRKIEDVDKFIIITGKNAPTNTPDLINFLDINDEIKKSITSAIWVGDRRWNIKINEDTVIMLPENNPEIAWNKYVQFSNQADFKEKNYKLIDLRIDNRIYAK
jgi:cell division protein FtsQ